MTCWSYYYPYPLSFDSHFVSPYQNCTLPHSITAKVPTDSYNELYPLLTVHHPPNHCNPHPLRACRIIAGAYRFVSSGTVLIFNLPLSKGYDS